MSLTVMAVVLVLAALQQIVAPVFLNPFRGSHAQMRAQSDTLIEPAGYAFAIWGPIYLLALGYAGLQLFSDANTGAVFDQVAPWAIALYLSSTLWLFLALRKLYWLTVPLLAAMALFASVALVSLVNGSDGTLLWWGLAIAPFGLYAGWTIAATAVNISSVASRVGFKRFGLSQVAFDIALLVSATLATLIVLWLTLGEISLVATTLWALLAIVVSNRQQKESPLILVACVVAAVLVITAAIGLGLGA